MSYVIGYMQILKIAGKFIYFLFLQILHFSYQINKQQGYQIVIILYKYILLNTVNTFKVHILYINLSIRYKT